jgi:hypothetical protein
MNNIQKHNNCTDISLSQTFRAYLNVNSLFLHCAQKGSLLGLIGELLLSTSIFGGSKSSLNLMVCGIL